MSFWKKVFKRYKKEKAKDEKGLKEDAYFRKLEKKLKNKKK